MALSESMVKADNDVQAVGDPGNANVTMGLLSYRTIGTTKSARSVKISRFVGNQAGGSRIPSMRARGRI